jgi:polyketide synthase PksL
MISADSKRDFEKVGSAIFLYIQQLCSCSQSGSEARVLIIGAFPDALEEAFLERWQALSNRPVCDRAFTTASELERWRRSFESKAAGIEPVLMTIGEDLPTAGFDLIAILETNFEISLGVITRLKWLLKRNGTILIASNTVLPVKGWLKSAGFQQIVARSDAQGAESIEIDCVIAKSDGRIRVSTQAEERSTESQSTKVLPPETKIAAPAERVPERERSLDRAAPNREAIRKLVISLIDQILQLPPGVLDTSSAFTEFGIDSIGGVVLINELNRRLGLELKPTVLFDYASVERLATYISEQCRPVGTELDTKKVAVPTPDRSLRLPQEVERSRPIPKSLTSVAQKVRKTDVAIVGISGRFPGADNVGQFWENLIAGKNSISDAPSDRWGGETVLANVSGRTSPRRGGFLSDAAEFDPLFFNISGREAEVTDPQQRLFLEEAYHALEDAGYAGVSANLAKKCGVFVGVEPGDYLHVLMELGDRVQNSSVFQGNADSILAARIAYFLDLKGPGIAINTACSSSLVSIHLACQSLINGECDLALAGGVRVLASDKAFRALGNMGMLSPDGQCKTFDEAADGFVPGEAVGILVLKPLPAALESGDHIYAVIKGSAINQDGRTNGITAPSSLSQTQVELEVYERFGLSPESFQYVEAHGTGTKLGDPIEVEALTAAFRKFTAKKSFCGIGSVKTNIGHTMAAAGVCSVIKVLLGLRHAKIPPSLNLHKANPYIDFEDSPFFVNVTADDWPVVAGQPRRAAVSSFGFSGTNSHLVLEEPPAQETPTRETSKPAYLVTVSAKSGEALDRQLQRFREWLDREGRAANLEDVSFTLNVGRGHFEHRSAFVVDSTEELREAVNRLVMREQPGNGWRSTVNRTEQAEDAIFRQLAAELIKQLPNPGQPDRRAYREKLSALAALYVKGYDFDPGLLHAEESHRRISLPAYAFARERYWISPPAQGTIPEKGAPRASDERLHPLVHSKNPGANPSEFVSSFDGSEFFFAEHQIRGIKILPGVAYLEMAIAAARELTGESGLALSNVAWLRPLTADQAGRVFVRLNRDGPQVRFEVRSGDGDLLHAEGKVICGAGAPDRREDLSEIRSRCSQTEDVDQIYARCSAAGLELGPAFRSIRQIWIGQDEALVRLEVTPGAGLVTEASSEFSLHPGLLDGALQTVAVLGQRQGTGLPVPFAVKEVRVGSLTHHCYAHVRRTSAEKDLLLFDIVLLDEAGRARVELNGLTMRVFAGGLPAKAEELVYVRPVWQKAPLDETAGRLRGRLLLFDHPDSELTSKIRELSSELSVVSVSPGPRFENFGDGFRVRPGSLSDYQKLLEAAPPNFVVFRWMTDTADINAALEHCVWPLFHFVRALVLQGIHHRVQLLVPYESETNPAYVALAGYSRTLEQERPNFQLKLVQSGAAGAVEIVRELRGQHRDVEVRYVDGERLVKRPEIFIPDLVAPLPIRESGVYLITGGLGGLGRIFSRYLAERYHAKVILIGRSKPAAEGDAFIAELKNTGADAIYFGADVAVRGELEVALAAARSQFGKIQGVIHAAGLIQDSFILKKEDFLTVMQPKVFGALTLDQLTANDPLEFFVLFSSIAGVFGNVGQSDYAYANRFLDEFARLRERRRASRERPGVTVSIAWPFWRNGGMRLDNELEIRRLSELGLQPLEEKQGLSIFETALHAGEPEIVGLSGSTETVRALLLHSEDKAGRLPGKTVSPAPDVRLAAILPERTLQYLSRAFSALVRIPENRIRPTDSFDKFGIDSIMVMEFSRLLEKDFADLPKTLLFEHRNLADLSAYFVSAHATRLQQLFGVNDEQLPKAGETMTPPEVGLASEAAPRLGSVTEAAPPSVRASEPVADEIAIIGVFGRYPMADDLAQFWDNLRSGRDCIVEIPPERWDYRIFYDPEPGKLGKTRNKWGGFMNDVDRFDAQFFSITPREASALDPQERLFLETAWRTVEDAGYRKSALAGKKVGVFVGVMYGQYQLYGAGDVETGNVFPLSSFYSSIANRVSYFFDWRGPSMAIDTMCSSSLTAIHLACESLHRRESEVALAGGVNATLHPHKDILMAPGGFAASDGRCRSFGEGGDGYVPGEGVGAVLLKRLSQAIADHDHIYAIIKASSLNHGGKTNGYTVPNPNAQADLVLEAFSQSRIDPTTVNYVEAHGTGTALGDPIEIAGMTKAFREAAGASVDSHRCAVGSVKSNIGHLESAAGIAGLTKVLLQMQHAEIVPSLHSARLNPNVRFAESSFYVPQRVETWEPTASRNDVPVRRAGVSSFGAGGANAHILIEEFVDSETRTFGSNGVPLVFVLSAKNEDRLRARAEQLADYLSRIERDRVPLIDLAYTLQVGREAFNQRLAIVANDLGKLSECLAGFLSGNGSEGIFRGNAQDDEERLRLFLDGEEGELLLESLIRQRKWPKLAQFWASGGEVNWERLYEGINVRRVSLPTYPFAGRRYWAPETLKLRAKQSDATVAGTTESRPNGTTANGSISERTEPLESAELFFLRSRWQERSRHGEVLFPEQARLLLFDREDRFQLNVQASHPGWSITRVVPGEAYTSGDGLAVIDPASPEDFRRLIRAAKPDFVIHRWMDHTNALDDALRYGVFTLFHLCQALIESTLHSTVRFIVCDREDSHPATTAFSAFARAVAQEQPQLQLRVIQSNGIDAKVLEELFTEDDEREIRWTNRARQVRLLEVFEPQAVEPVTLRRRGVYLITGGLGGLGQIFAKRFAKDFAARLILTGRSALAESGLSTVRELEQLGAEVQYLQCDVGSAHDVAQLIGRVRERFGGLNGILHAAGVLRDGFLLKKSFAEFADVLRSKVYGTTLLDEATKEEPLDFFALFSSTAGAFGNVGQVDYSYANAFLDGFASLRERLRNEGRRNGKTFSIAWPLWEDRGMARRAPNAIQHLKQIGLYPISEELGYRIFEIALMASEPQIVPLYGSREKTARWLFGAQAANQKTGSPPLSKPDEARLLERTETYLKSILAEVTQLPVDQLDSRQRFEEFGVDSIVVTDFNLRIDKDLGPLAKTLLFEHANFRQLSVHLVEAFGTRLAQFFAPGIEAGQVDSGPAGNGSQKETHTVSAGVVRSESSPAQSEGIAIIGLAGRYPKADDVHAFWKILRAGADCVTEIPKERWDIDRFFDPDPEKAAAGKMYGRWGAFLDEVDKFDSLFFNIPPIEAELVDPQERLFLETAWSVLEDAGYTRLDLARTVRPDYAANVGVFVGVTSNDYARLAQERRRGGVIPTTLPWSIANRVSYLFNFNGPSIPVDTACSSSLTAVHLACEAIRRGECQQAIAGGVNLYLHPSRYVSLCLARMLSTDGKCRAFGEGGNGFVPGEGVGVVFLKPLSLALIDRDHIYGVIKGTAVNHGGRTNGYTVPNPKAQSELIKRALKQANIEPGTVTYLEAHGTGTALGDPIELAGLAAAFNETSQKPLTAGACALASVKTNIGHLESAAGIAGLTKILLQFKAGELAPSLHGEKINPNLVLDGSPFRLQRTLEPWASVTVDNRICPRRAGISSFGAGGANAHVIVEEFVAGAEPEQTPSDAPMLIVLSARSEDSLRNYAMRLTKFVLESRPDENPMQSLAYTLQVGRESFEQRIAFIVANRDELVTNLERVGAGDLINMVHGRVRRERIQLDNELDEPDPAVAGALRTGDLEALAKFWAGGAVIDWSALWGQTQSVRRISLPTYAFRRERYWIDEGAKPAGEKPAPGPVTEESISLPNGRSYERAFSGEEIVLRDHQIGGNSILPGAASLDFAMLAAAETLASPSVRLRNIVWLRPLISGSNGLNIRLNVRQGDPDRVAFDLTDSEGQVAMQGKAERIADPSSERLNFIELRNRCASAISPDELYRIFADRQMKYGPGFRVLQDVRYGTDEVLAELRVQKVWSDETQRLHPALIDGALQSLSAIGPREGEVYIPFALESLECASSLPDRCYAYSQVQGEGASRRFEIRLLNEAGDVLGRLAGLRMRPVEPVRMEIIVCRPIWVSEPPLRQSSFTGKVLLFDDETELAERIEQQGSKVIRVTFAKPTERCERDVWLSRGDQEAYNRLVADQDFDAIIHTWSLSGASTLEDGLERGPLSVHRLARALMETGKVAPWLFVYPAAQPLYQAIAGYSKSLRQEHPKLQLKTVGVSDSSPADLLSELGDPAFEIRYHGDGHREVRRLDELVMPSALAESALRSGGVYLLTGGAGGLGRIFSRYLVETFGARLVLAGRSERPSEWAAELGESAVYVQADISTVAGAEKAVTTAKERFGKLQGIIHAAGVLHDGLIRSKSEEEFLAVWRAKAQGAEVLDQVTRNEPLDFFVLFSSLAALVGNAGQADYAYANAYLDAFAGRREELRARGQRSGYTVSINWPLWKEGGMQAGAEDLRLQTAIAGLQPLETDEGVRVFSQIMATREVQCAVFCGSPRRWLSRLQAPADQASALPPGSASSLATPMPTTPKANGQLATRADLLEKLRELVGRVLKLDPSLIENDADTSEYGFDSVTFTTLANELNAELGVETTPAVLFEYTTLETLADFLSREYGDQLDLKIKPATGVQLVGGAVVPARNASRSDAGGQHSHTPLLHHSGFTMTSAEPVAVNHSPSGGALSDSGLHSIAVVGMSGVFPGSPNLDWFWKHLESGEDLISKPPPGRWNFPANGQAAGGAVDFMEPPWGGFIPHVDQFDPLFFDISPREAELMDPQQRIFLQSVWHTLEDAGYSKSRLAGSKTGVFVGVAANDYAALLAMAGIPVEAYSSTGNAHSVLANRVSYFFDWHGPSEAIDTACSSSLVAIHRAIESIASGSCNLAIAGGVNVLLSPAAFVAFGKAGMLCPDGRCKSFDADANGYVRGEGVGTILLKPFRQALQDRDHIYAVIRGSAENHGGRVQGLTVPNPNAQAGLLKDAYEKAGIDPFTIGYIEAHGTGTSLGDPMEVNGLKKGFGQKSDVVPDARCAIASVKSNIGHLETAAGMAGIIKVLLSMRHRRIPGNIHLKRLNPYIQVEGTPFYFPEKTVSWEPLIDRTSRTLPRRAGVSSFGFGGSNAHVVLEEFAVASTVGLPDAARPELVIFSARNSDRLRALVSNFIEYLRSLRLEANAFLRPSLSQVAFTLQVGREAMNERLALIASDIDGLLQQLDKFERAEPCEGFAGNLEANKAGLQLLQEVHPDDSYLDPLLGERELRKLARLWVGGVRVPWEKLWIGNEVSRVPLPGYPFEQQRFWVPKLDLIHPASDTRGPRLHPLLHRNESTLKSQVYRSEFDGHEIFFRDHRVAGREVLPGAASLELALAGASLALETTNVALRRIVWLRPIVGGSERVALSLTLRSDAEDALRFEIKSSGPDVHVSGSAEVTHSGFSEDLDLAAIRSRCQQEVSSDQLYEAFAQRGLEYGDGFRVIEEIQYSDSEALSLLQVPSTWGNARFRLHPALLDGAFQSLATIESKSESGIKLPFAVDKIVCSAPLPPRCFAFVQLELSDKGERRHTIKLANEEGRVLASISGLSCRRLAADQEEPFYYQPVWKQSELVVTERSEPEGSWLLFDNQVTANRLFGEETRVIRVVAGDHYEVSGSNVTIRAENDADYERLVREFEFGAVVHGWARPTTDLAEASQRGVSSMHLLVQAMLRAKKKRPIAFVYPIGIPAFEAVGGYAKSLYHEHPDWLVKTIGSGSGPMDFAGELQSSDFEVRYLEGRREIKTLEPALCGIADEPSLRQGGVYLISGGAGGLGRIFARYLAERYDARVVLVGRSPGDETIQDELRSLGANSVYFSADIGTREGAHEAVEHAKTKFGAINGVVHAAGVLRDGLIWNKTLPDIAAVLRPKVSGAEALDAATSGEKLDWFVLFSSVAGLLGNAGQSDYAYANAYLDAFAYHREELRCRGERTGHSLSINWPVWRDGGMRPSAGSDRDRLGLRPLEREQGLEIFERALAAKLTQVWAGFGDREEIRNLLFGTKNQRQTRAAGPKPQIVCSRHSELVGYLTSKLAGVLKLEERQIKPAESLESYGFDSIVAVEFSQLLEKDFGELSKTLLFEYPTLESLAAYLIELTRSGGDQASHERAASRSSNGSSETRTGSISTFATTARSARSLELAPTDYLFVGPGRLAIQVLYYFENRLDFELLKTGLQRVAQSFYPINSRLIKNGDRAYVIEESADPPDFAEVTSTEALPEQDKPTSFEPFRVSFNPLAPREKLAKFRLMQLKSGSLLNVNVSHAIADGYSYYYFLTAWAAACRGEPFQEPIHVRAVLRDKARAYLKEQANHLSDDALELDLRSPAPRFDPTTERIETLRIEPEQLIAEARKSVEPEMRGWLTENSVVTALVWQTYARALSMTGDLTLACPMDFRRMMPELSPAFFGNASAPAILRLTSEAVLNLPIGQLAIRISDSIHRCDAVTLIRYSAKIDQLRVEHGLAAVDRMGLINPRTGLIVTNVARFPLPPVDFGPGKFTREYTPTNYAGTGVIVSEAAGIKVRLAYPN